MKENYILCKQKRASKGQILSVILLIIAIAMFFVDSETLVSKFLFLFIALVILGTSVFYKITPEFDNKKIYMVFGIPIFKIKLDVVYPDYISIAPGKFKSDNEYSSVAALGTEEKYDMFALRFFKNNKNDKIYMSSSYEDVLEKAKWLSNVLNTEIYDATKN